MKTTARKSRKIRIIRVVTDFQPFATGGFFRATVRWHNSDGSTDYERLHSGTEKGLDAVVAGYIDVLLKENN